MGSTKGAVAKIHREPKARRTLRLMAAKAVRNELQAGRLPRLDGLTPCFYCGTRPAVHYEHRSYYRPLDVKPACKRCNRMLPSAEPAWLADYTAAMAQKRTDQRQVDLQQLVERGADISAIGVSLGVTRERARQLIWMRGLRSEWITARQRVRAAGQRETAAKHVSRWLRGGSAYRERFLDEATRRGLKVRIIGGTRHRGARRFEIEGVPVRLHKTEFKPHFTSPDFAPTHPGYIHVHVNLGTVNAYSLPDGRFGFVVSPGPLDNWRAIYVRPDHFIFEWPTPTEWADIAAVLSVRAVSIDPESKEESA